MIVCTTMDLLADYLGLDTALKLIAALGGRDLVVPKRREGATWERLVEAAGEEAAGRMVELFGGEKLYIPLNRAGEVEAQREWVLRQRAAGRTLDEIAADAVFTMRRTTRWVRRVLAAADQMARKMEEGQLSFSWQDRRE